MREKIDKININSDEEQKIKDKSPDKLPLNPSVLGYSGSQIRKKFSGFIIDDEDSILSVLKEKLHYIKESFLDLEERQDIVKGSLDELINNEVLQGVIATDIEDKLNAKEQEYTPRLTNAENEIINLKTEKSDKSYVDQLTQSLANGSPKGTYENLAALQLEIPDGNNNIYITLDNGHWNYYDFNTNEWKSGGVYQTTGIGEFSITHKHLSNTLGNLFSVSISKNLLDMTKIENGKTISISGDLSSDSSKFVTDFIPVEPNDKLVYSVDGVQQVFKRIAAYDGNKTHIETITTDTNIYTVPINGKYVRAAVYNNKLETGQHQIEKGENVTAYEPYGEEEYSIKGFKALEERIDVLEDNVAALEEQIDEMIVLEPSRNLFDGLWESGYYSTSSGADRAGDFQRTISYIEVDISKPYTLTKSHELGSVIHCYDESKNWLGYINLGTVKVVVINFGGQHEFLPNTKYVRFHSNLGTAPNINDYSLWQFEEGTEATPYSPYEGTRIINPDMIKGVSGGGAGGVVLEKHLMDEIDRVVEELLSMKSDLTFSFVTDTHSSLFNNLMYKYDIQSELNSRGVLDFTCLGGDNFDGASTALKEVVRKHMLEITNRTTKKAVTDTFILEGNHDTNGYAVSVSNNPGGLIKPYERFNVYNRQLGSNIIFDSDNPFGGYFYKDYQRSKIRVIVLNTSDYYFTDENGDLLLDVDGEPVLNPMSLHFQQKQFDWIQNKALNFMDKGEDRQGWAVVILSHGGINPITGREVNGLEPLVGILNAYMNGTTYVGESTETGYRKLHANCDFTEQGEMEFICSINGHRHWDRVANIVGLTKPRPSIDVANNYPAVHYKINPLPEGATVPTDRTDGTVNAELFDIFTIDREARKIRTIRFGAGSDRVIDY